jgi:hypothetical protein
MSYREMVLAMSGRRAKWKSELARRAIREAVEIDRRKALDGIVFASAEAGELAREAGLSWWDFQRGCCKKKTKFGADDVRRVIARRRAPV